MGTQEQDAMVGKLVREYMAARKEIGTIKAMLRDDARAFKELGQALESRLEDIRIQGNNIVLDTPKDAQPTLTSIDEPKTIALLRVLDATEFTCLLTELRRQQELEKSLAESLKEAGLECIVRNQYP